MSGLKQMMKNKIEDDRGLSTKLARMAGYKSDSALWKFVNIPEREPEKFSCLLKWVEELFPEQEKEILSDYIRTLDPNKKTARSALEYCNINKMYSLQEELIQAMKKASNAFSKEFAKVYDIEYKSSTGEITPLEAINNIDGFTTKSSEMTAFSQISKFYSYYDLGLIETMTRMSGIIESLIKNIDEDYLKDSYNSRLVHIMLEIGLHNGQVEWVRKYGEDEIKKCKQDTIKTMLYLHVGNSYIFEDYQKAYEFLSKSNKLAEKVHSENGILQSQRSLNFLSSYWNKESYYLNMNSDKIADIHGVAFNLIQRGLQRGLDILQSIDKSKLTNKELGFHYLYRGKASKDKKDYLKSVKYFNLAGEKFYKKAPLIELQKMGIEECILDTLSV